MINNICSNCKKTYNGINVFPIYCSCGFKIYKNGEVFQYRTQNSKKESIPTLDHWGRSLWEELHKQQVNVRVFENWKKKIPCGSCVKDFNNLLKNHPPDFSSQEKFFEWTVKIHNKVNEKLNKPTFTLEQAKERWCIINQSDF